MKCIRHLSPLIILCAVILLTLILSIGQVAGQEPGPGASDVDTTLYLPLVRRAPGTIYGHVTAGGVAAPAVSLELHRLNAVTLVDTLLDTKTSLANGYFEFTNKPSLLANQLYFVKYSNPSASLNGRLWRWYTRALASYTAGSIVNIGDFDIADVALSQPTSGATVTLPRTFSWVRRPSSPTDSYEFNLFEDCDHCALFYTKPPLGYVSSYWLAGLPAGFDYHTVYYWEIWVHSPDGGYGISYESRPVIFTHTGLSAAPATDLPATERERRHAERLLRNLQVVP